MLTVTSLSVISVNDFVKLETKNAIELFQVSSLLFAEDVKLLKEITKKAQNCDDVYGKGYRSSRIYDIFTGKRFVEAFCELEQVGNNWLVRTSYKNDIMKQFIFVLF